MESYYTILNNTREESYVDLKSDSNLGVKKSRLAREVGDSCRIAECCCIVQVRVVWCLKKKLYAG